MFHSNTVRIIVIGLCISYLSKHKYNEKKTCCTKIVPTDCFACKTHQGTQQLKKAILFKKLFVGTKL